MHIASNIFNFCSRVNINYPVTPSFQLSKYCWIWQNIVLVQLRLVLNSWLIVWGVRSIWARGSLKVSQFCPATERKWARGVAFKVFPSLSKTNNTILLTKWHGQLQGEWIWAMRFPYPHSFSGSKGKWTYTTFSINVVPHFVLLSLKGTTSRGVHWRHSRRQGNNIQFCCAFFCLRGVHMVRSKFSHVELHAAPVPSSLPSLATVLIVGLQFESFRENDEISQQLH